MNQRSLTLDETVRYIPHPEMLGDLPRALHRAHEHIQRLEQACEDRNSALASVENRIDDLLDGFQNALEALDEVFDDSENKRKAAALEKVIRGDLKARVSELEDLFCSFDASDMETVEQLAAEF